MMNKRGFTLMELLVYMAIVGIVVVIAGQVYSDSTKMRVRTQSMIAASDIAENVGSLMRDDIAQMGAKSAKGTAGSYNSDAFVFNNKVYMKATASTGDTPDSSSFAVSHDYGGNGLDSLTLRRISYNDSGKYVRVEEVAWFAKSGALYRSCKTLDGTQDADLCPTGGSRVEIAQGVDSFVVTPSKPGSLGGSTSDPGRIFPNYSGDASKKSFRLIPYFGTDNFMRVNSSPTSGSTSITLSGLTSNYSEDGSAPSDPPKRHMLLVAESGSTTEGVSNCKKITFKNDSTYEISFNMLNLEDETRMFQPGVDHLSVGIRDVESGTPSKISGVEDFYFYPPQNDDGINGRTMRFKVHGSADVNACVAFTMALYSPTVSLGSFTISDLQIRKVRDFDYEFEDGFTPTLDEKKDVRAFKVKLKVKKNKESGFVDEVIPVPSNGVRG